MNENQWKNNLLAIFLSAGAVIATLSALFLLWITLEHFGTHSMAGLIAWLWCVWLSLIGLWLAWGKPDFGEFEEVKPVVRVLVMILFWIVLAIVTHEPIDDPPPVPEEALTAPPR